MNNTQRSSRRLSVQMTLLAALCLCLGAARTGAQQTETSAGCDEGTFPEPVELVYGNTTTGCTVAPTTDTDRFFFSGQQDDQVRVRLVVQTNNLDPILEVRDSTNALLGTSSCFSASNTRCSTQLALTLPASGDYLIIVLDNGADNGGDYELGLERLFPDPSLTPLPYDQTLGDAVGPGTDIDYYHFDATSGTLLEFSLLTTSLGMDPRVEIRDPNGAVIIAGASDGAACNSASNTVCSFRVEFEPGISGRYSVLVYDDDGFNPGDYNVSLWCAFGPCDGAPTPDPDGPVLLYVPTTPDSLEVVADADIRTFNATAGTSLRLRLNTLSLNLDPRIEVRDPNGSLVINGLADGAACNSASNTFCWLTVDLEPALTGTYTVMVYDDDGFNTGAYEMALWCLLGECDGDGDLLVDGDREVLSYGVSVTDNLLETASDADFYEFMGTVGDEIRITVAGQTLNLDPRIELRDPTGAVVTDGSGGSGCNSASNTICSFAYTVMPTMTGTYSMVLYDDDSFNAGDYDVTLECLFGTGPGFTCADLAPPPLLCADNCSSIANLDQRDTNMDGAGNVCDADLNGDLIVNVIDLGLFRERFFTADPEADFNNDGVVNVIDLGLLRRGFFAPPGPSCAYPNLP